MTNAVDKIIQKEEAIHGFVVNAGRTKHKAALDFTTEEIEQLWNVNVCVHRLRRRKEGAELIGVDAAVRLVLLRESGRESIHQTGYKRFHSIYCLYGVLQTKQGACTTSPDFCRPPLIAARSAYPQHPMVPRRPASVT